MNNTSLITLCILVSALFACSACDSSEANAQDSTRHAAANADTHAATTDRDVSPLEPHAWEHRPVIIFAPSDTHDTYRRQVELFDNHRDGLRDRDIVVYRVFPDAGTGPDGSLPPDARRALRTRFAPDSSFAVILVGKDTTEKLRRDELLDIHTLFSTIDAMPMRQREMKRRNDTD